MAKRKKTRRSTPKTRTIIRSAPRRKSVVRSGFSAAKAKAKQNRGMIMSLVGAALLGAIEARGLDSKIPQIPYLGTSGTLGVAGYALGHAMKNDDIKTASLGALAVSAYRVGVQIAGSTPAPTVSGVFDAPPAPTVSGVFDAPPAAQQSRLPEVPPALLGAAMEMMGANDDDSDDDEISGEEEYLDLSGSDDDESDDE